MGDVSADLDAVLEREVLSWAAVSVEVRETVDRHVADFGDIVIGRLASEVSPIIGRHLVGLLRAPV